MKKNEPYHGRLKIRYCSRKHDEKYAKKQGYIAPFALIKTIKFITIMGFPGLIQRLGLASWNIKIVWIIFQFIDVFA